MFSGSTKEALRVFLQDFEKPYDPQETARRILGQVPVAPVQQLLIAPPSTGFVFLLPPVFVKIVLQ